MTQPVYKVLSKSTGMVEISNRLLEDVLRKQGGEWDQNLDKATHSLSTRVIGYLGMSPNDILMGRAVEESDRGFGPKKGNRES